MVPLHIATISKTLFKILIHSSESGNLVSIEIVQLYKSPK